MKQRKRKKNVGKGKASPNKAGDDGNYIGISKQSGPFFKLREGRPLTL